MYQINTNFIFWQWRDNISQFAAQLALISAHAVQRRGCSITEHHMPLYLLSSNMDQCLALTSAVTALPACSIGAFRWWWRREKRPRHESHPKEELRRTESGTSIKKLLDGDTETCTFHIWPTKWCSKADKREGAAGCVAPVGVFLSLAELLRACPPWRRFREDIHWVNITNRSVFNITVDVMTRGEEMPFKGWSCGFFNKWWGIPLVTLSLIVKGWFDVHVWRTLILNHIALFLCLNNDTGDVMSPDRALEMMAAGWCGTTPCVHVKRPDSGSPWRLFMQSYALLQVGWFHATPLSPYDPQNCQAFCVSVKYARAFCNTPESEGAVTTWGWGDALKKGTLSRIKA